MISLLDHEQNSPPSGYIGFDGATVLRLREAIRKAAETNHPDVIFTDAMGQTVSLPYAAAVEISNEYPK